MTQKVMRKTNFNCEILVIFGRGQDDLYFWHYFNFIYLFSWQFRPILRHMTAIFSKRTTLLSNFAYKLIIWMRQSTLRSIAAKVKIFSKVNIFHIFRYQSLSDKIWPGSSSTQGNNLNYLGYTFDPSAS